MRLLHSETLQLTYFMTEKAPRYAILSHTWGEEEVTFQDMEGSNKEKKAGYAKIKGCCDIAFNAGYEYVWIDTCCIDKSSSAELSESINSMYNFYKKAGICYAFLEDFPPNEDPKSEHSVFKKCRWFTRGWTLQELLAPLNLVFLASDWSVIGTKYQLRAQIAGITGIDDEVIGNNIFKSKSIAEKMSWASKRETTRLEDMAYCLMGIFDVNMPLLYGEGEKAFIRLQEEIMKDSDDETIFAWRDTTAWSRQKSGLLAPSPVHFVDSGNCGKLRAITWKSAPYYKTNKGLYLQLPLIHIERNVYAAILNCCVVDWEADRPESQLVSIYLEQVFGNYVEKEQFARVRAGEFKMYKIGAREIVTKLTTVYVKQSQD